MNLHNLALALAVQDRLKEALPRLTDSARHQRQAMARAPQQTAYRQRLSGVCALQVRIERDLQLLQEALDTTTRRRELWPGNAGELFAVAQDFAGTATA